MAGRIWSPSEIASRRGHRGARLNIAGRVVRVDASGVVIADALARVPCSCATPFALEPFDWVVVQAQQTRGGMQLLRVLERKAASTPLAEFERFHSLGLGKTLQARARAVQIIRRYFDEHGFLEVQTPTWVKAPGTDRHIEALRSESGYLITSPEFQMKRLLAGGLPRIYQLAQVFRKGEQGDQHECEFTMLEWYRLHQGYQETQRDTERVVSRVVRALNGGLTLRTAHGSVVCKPPFERITVRAAFQKYAGIADAADLAASNESLYFELLVSKVEPALAKRKKPVFLIDYPMSQAALARQCPTAPGYAERFELYLGGVELCNGYGELTDAQEQRARFVDDNHQREASGQPPMPLDEALLGALHQGLPPCTGNALGLDRLIMLALGAPTVQRVMAFPKTAM